MPIPINNDFDQSTIITNLTINNLAEVPFEKMLEILTPYVLVQIPEDTESIQEKQRLDYLLARCANLYAYILALWGQSSYLRARYKTTGDSRSDDMQKKKETLYALAGAMKLKYEAASRKITVLLEDEDDSVVDRVNYESRRTTRNDRSDRKDDKVKATTTPPNSGWSSVA